MIGISVSDFCCQFHVNDCQEVKLECIQFMNEIIDRILSRTVVGENMSQLSLM